MPLADLALGHQHEGVDQEGNVIVSWSLHETARPLRSAQPPADEWSVELTKFGP